jgi:GH25 family lysozyme M1 (1,4-beta-N-acetylmuramidase)
LALTDHKAKLKHHGNISIYIYIYIYTYIYIYIARKSPYPFWLKVQGFVLATANG